MGTYYVCSEPTSSACRWYVLHIHVSSEPTSSTCPWVRIAYRLSLHRLRVHCPWVRITYALSLHRQHVDGTYYVYMYPLSLHRLRVHGYVLRIVWTYIVYVSTVHGYQGWGNLTQESYSCVIVGHFRGTVLVLNYICQKDKVIVLVLDYFVKVIVLMIPFTITLKINVFLIRIIRFCW